MNLICNTIPKNVASRANELQNMLKNSTSDPYHKEVYLQQPRVEKTVSRAVGIFLETLKESRLLTKNEQEALSNILRKCSENVIFDSEVGPRNAGISLNTKLSFLFGNLLYGHADGASVDTASSNVLYPIKNIGCLMELNAATWIDCANNRAICYQSLFHELGHVFNSCHFWKLSETYKRYRHDVTDRNAVLLKKGLSNTVSQAKEIAMALEISTGCLSELSSPHDAIPNSCADIQRFTEHVERRCGPSPVKGYPSQWYEAEADFWSASAFAQYLKIETPNLMQRQKLLYDVMAQWCYEKGSKATSEDSKIATDPCALKPMTTKQMSKPWLDSHQSMPTRFNRNYLRNSDLRSAIGCTLNAEIPLACSPLGVRRMILPKP